jgi:hypothetical protein
VTALPTNAPEKILAQFGADECGKIKKLCLTDLDRARR